MNSGDDYKHSQDESVGSDSKDNSGNNDPPKKEEDPIEPEKKWWEKGIWKKWKEVNDREKLREAIRKLPLEMQNELEKLGVFDEDFTGIVYGGYGISGTALIGVTNEYGIAYEFRNGELIVGEEYQSASVGFVPDIGAGVFGVIPKGQWSDFLGIGGAASAGASKYVGLAIGVITPNNEVEGKEFFLNAGYSKLSVDINMGSVTYTRLNAPSQASSIFIPYSKGNKK